MSYTKGEIVSEAFTEIGIANYVFDVGPEETTTTLRKLDRMMAEWAQRGVHLSYPLPSGADCSSVDEESGIPDFALEAVITNLACRIAPSYGKAVNPETKVAAKEQLSQLRGAFAKAPEQRFNLMPKGAGYKTTERRWIPQPKDELAVGDDSLLDLQGVLNVNTD